MTINELRAWARDDAADEGKTLELKLDEMERQLGLKDYVDGLRILFGIKEPSKDQ